MRFGAPEVQGGGAALLTATRSRSAPVSLFPAFIPVYTLKYPYLSAFRNRRKKCSTRQPGWLQCPRACCLLPVRWPSLGCCALPRLCSAMGMCDGDTRRAVQRCRWPCVSTRLPARHCCSGKVTHRRGSFAGRSRVLKPWPEAKHGLTPRG